MYNKNLCNLHNLDPDFIIDLRYATEDNFTGIKLYDSNTCYLNTNTARLLIRAKNIFKKDGLKVKVWDAYRPISVQKKMWELYPDDRFVARPPDIAKIKDYEPSHLNGQCVDIILTDNDENDLIMPSYFDDFTKRANIACQETPLDGRKNALYMKYIMESVGFGSYECEWWHFRDITFKPEPYLDYPL